MPLVVQRLITYVEQRLNLNHYRSFLIFKFIYQNIYLHIAALRSSSLTNNNLNADEGKIKGISNLFAIEK